MKDKNYFFKAFLAILLSVLAFYLFKLLLPERFFPEVTAISDDNIVVDSLLIAALADTTSISDTISTDTTSTVVETELKQEQIQLTSFFERLYALEQTKKGKVRVAYFGDSMIEGDLIVRDIRKNYQSKYGGKGAGLIPISLPIQTSSTTVKHNYSKDWNIYSYLNNTSECVGVNGYVFFQPDGAEVWSKYKAAAIALVNPVLLYGKSHNSNALLEVSTDIDSTKNITLHPDNLLNIAKLSPTVNNLTIHFSNTDSIPFYGVDFSDTTGIYIDNFSARGNSGLPLSTFDIPLMNAFQKRMGYNLIVLHYGTNVLSSKSMEYHWYAVRMERTVRHLHKCFPEASILVVSLADKATKYGTEIKTDSALIPLIKAQQTYAAKTQSGFLNLYELMGGEGAMVEWVNEEPPLAAKDFTHFSTRGAKKIADLIFEKLEEEYENFKYEKQSEETIKNAVGEDTENLDYEL